jgi:hypothetical protein
MSIDRPTGSEDRAMRAEDVDPGPLIGTWRNTNPDTGQIAGLHIQVVDGRAMLNVWGSSGPSHRDWGRIPIGRLYQGNPGVAQASAFEAQFEFGPMSALLEANLSKGLLIIACMKTFRDDSGRSNYFVREFFRRTDDGPPPALAPVDRGRRPITCADDEPPPGWEPPGTRRLDSKLFIGHWKNTDSGTPGLREVWMDDRDGTLMFEAGSAGDRTGEGPHGAITQPFAGSAASAVATQFHTGIERAGQRIVMHGWVKLGVMVIAVFRSPTDSSGIAPWFDREFFYQSDRL